MEDLLAQARTLVNRWDHGGQLAQTLAGLARVYREMQVVLDRAEGVREGLVEGAPGEDGAVGGGDLCA